MRARRVLSYLLLAAGALFLFVGGRDLVESKLGQEDAQKQFEAAPEPKPSPFDSATRRKIETAPPSIPPELGQAIARLTIPRLHTDLYVVEGDGDRQLRLGPGHIAGTAMPGSDGNCIIAGHRDTHFRALKDIQKGDEIVLRTHGGRYTYRVQEMEIVAPDNTQPLRPTRGAELHLVTCYPFYYVGSAPKRFIVEASLVGTMPGGPGRTMPTGITTSRAPRPPAVSPARPGVFPAQARMILASGRKPPHSAHARSSRKMN
jgi:sortase A